MYQRNELTFLCKHYNELETKLFISLIPANNACQIL